MGDKYRLGSISTQGNVFLRTMLVEAAHACRNDEEFHREHRHRCHRKPKWVAKVAAARKVARTAVLDVAHPTNPYASAVHKPGSPSHSVAG